MDLNETIQDYVRRVGSPFAVAFLGDEISSLHKKLKKARGLHREIEKILAEAIDADDLDDELEAELQIMRDLRERSIWEKIRRLEDLRIEVYRMGPVQGDRPGTQEALNALGIQVKLKTLKELFADHE